VLLICWLNVCVVSAATIRRVAVPFDPVWEMADRINRYWSQEFSRCHWPAYVAPRTEQLTTRFLANNPQFRSRSAFYVPSFDPNWPPNLREVLYVNDANLYRDRDRYAVLAPGAYAAEITLAHELGHRVQDLRGTMHGRPHRTQELEADFFAGTYVHWLNQNNNLPPGMITAGNLSRRAAGDPPGTPPNHPQSHGTGLQRGNAFMAGVTQGLPAGFCATGIAIP
jgi:predicted metalloprotease